MDNCNKIEKALLLVSKKWNMKIIRYLLNGEARFKDIETNVNISAKVLCERLKELEQHDIILHDKTNATYSLTKQGIKMKPIIDEINHWAERYIK